MSGTIRGHSDWIVHFERTVVIGVWHFFMEEFFLIGRIFVGFVELFLVYPLLSLDCFSPLLLRFDAFLVRPDSFPSDYDGSF